MLVTYVPFTHHHQCDREQREEAGCSATNWAAWVPLREMSMPLLRRVWRKWHEPATMSGMQGPKASLFAFMTLGPAQGWLHSGGRARLQRKACLHQIERLPATADLGPEAPKTFETAAGFQMELMAHEPMVEEPVVATFDENGRMYVAELRGYPYQPGEGEEPTGRVRLLEDRDGGGRFDVSHIFADRLIWPTGAAVWKEEVFVCAPPDIFYMKDTDGDGRADIRETVYTGFGVTNEQAMVNNIMWGVDHKIYASTGADGGYIRPRRGPRGRALLLERPGFPASIR